MSIFFKISYANVFLLAALLCGSTIIAADAFRPWASIPQEKSIERCAVDESSLTTLDLASNNELYVEPVALASSGPNILIAGWPSYLWGSNPDGSKKRIPSDSVFGAVFDTAGRARLIRSPFPSRLLDGVRALGRGDGTWDIVFAELIPYPVTEFFPPDTASRLWHGVYDGHDWVSLKTIPIPTDFTPHPNHASALVRSGDTLAWAVPVSAPGYRKDVLVLEQREGRWASQIIHSRQAAYTALTFSDATGLLVAIVQPDTSLASDQNSLFLYARQPSWYQIGRVAHGGSEPVFRPTFASSSDGVILSWTAGANSSSTVRTILLASSALPGNNTSAVTIDSQSSRTPVFTTFISNKFPIWVVEHESSTGDRDSRELRFISITDGSSHLLKSIQSPFLSGFRATKANDSVIVLAGARWSDDIKKDIVVSAVLRTTINCLSGEAL